MLPRLNSDPNQQVNVQQTEFSEDVLGRWVCSSWPEVNGNGGDPFDVVVIGAGMFGGYIADKMYRRGGEIGLRILVVEAGSFLHSYSRSESSAYGIQRTGLTGGGGQCAGSWRAKPSVGTPLA